MKHELKILALIPARAGSKRIANKNIKLLGAKPLIAYTIEAAKSSKYVNRIIVSTDSQEIARIAEKFGAEVPFMRPTGIASDESTEYQFHLHAVEWLQQNENYTPDLIVNLYPTSPFRKAETIDSGIEKMLHHEDADSLRSVKKCSEHPYKMWTVSEDFLVPFVGNVSMEEHTYSYQMLPDVYIQNASIYITKVETLKKYNNTLGENVLSLVMDESESVDINSPIDFMVAEKLLESMS